MKLDTVSKYMEKAGIPGRDRYNLPDSNKRFPDGAHYRIEMSGVEGPEVLEAIIKEKNKRNVPVHRLISLVGGGYLYDDEEVKYFAQMAAEEKMEVIAVPGPRNGRDMGRQYFSEEGMRTGQQHRGSDQLRNVIADIMRMYDLGIRGFMLVDRGLLWLMKTMQEQGNLPKDMAFKMSVWTGVSAAPGAKLMEDLGASSFNPIADLPLPMLASIREVVDIPIDFYIWTFESFGGTERFYEAADVARLYSPCYFKFEPETSSGEGYAPWANKSHQIELMKNKIKWAEFVINFIKENEPDIKLSDQGPDDLFIPVVK
ncbi:MAG: hypothetical protein ACQESS_09680 [Bacillota bacterium]